MNVGNIIGILLGLGFLYLLFMAIRKMARSHAQELPSAEKEEALSPEELEQELAEEEEQEEAAEKEFAEAPPPKTRKKIDLDDEKKRLAAGLTKTRSGFISKLGGLFRGRSEIDPQMLEHIEEILFTADIGVQTSQELIEHLRKKLSDKDLQDREAVWSHLQKQATEMLTRTPAEPLEIDDKHRPFVIMMVGVNGTGKTTTIGKLAANLVQDGYRVLLAAGDTFRAAAVEQLCVWGERAGCPVVRGKEGADPTSVLIDALKKAQEDKMDIVIADTAGRLHTKVDLMEEIKKSHRSMSKHVAGAPHETLLVLDSTTGQNAISQAKLFKEALSVTGIVLTKLDGTAKGGVVLGICNELKLPIRYIGIGEKMDDLREFNAEAFAQALFDNGDLTNP